MESHHRNAMTYALEVNTNILMDNLQRATQNKCLCIITKMSLDQTLGKTREPKFPLQYHDF